MLAFLKFTLTSLKKNFFTVVLLYILVPVVMVFYYGFLQGDTQNSKTNTDIPTFQIIDDDKTELSKLLSSVLSSKTFNSMYSVSTDATSKEEIDFTLLIPSGYMNAVKNQTSLNLDLTGSEDTGSVEGALLTSFVNNINKSLITNYSIEKKIVNAIDDNEIQSKVLNEYTALKSQVQKPLGKFEKIDFEKALSGYKLYTITVITFLFFLIIMAPIQLAAKNKNQGFEIRLASLPMSFASLFTAKIVATAFECFVLTSIYIMFFRLLGFAFTANIIWLFIYTVIFSLLAGVLANIFLLGKNKKLISAIVSVVFMIFVVAGDLVGNLLFADNEKFSKILKYNFTSILTDPLKNIELHNSNLIIIKGLGIILIMALVTYLLGIIIGTNKKNKI